MSSPGSWLVRRSLVTMFCAAALWAVTSGAQVWACGPHIDPAFMMMDDLDDRYVLCDGDAPLVKLQPPVDRPCAAISALLRFPAGERFPAKLVRTAEVAEAEAAARFGAGTAALAAWRAFAADPLVQAPPEGAPESWVLYARGVALMRAGRDAEAAAAFRAAAGLRGVRGLEGRGWRLAEDRARAVWALYMLGNMARSRGAPGQEAQEAQEAAGYYRELRRRVRAGAPDALGLALASLRQEALALEGLEDGRAALLCRDYVESGGRRGCADVQAMLDRVLPLTVVDASGLRAALPGMPVALALALAPERLDRAARDPVMAAMVSAWLASDLAAYLGAEDYAAVQQAWLGAVERAGAGAGGGGLRRIAPALARLAYDRGEWRAAARWAALGDARDPMAAGVRARLARRRGDDAGVIAALSGVRPLDMTHGAWLMRAQMNRRRYGDAMATAMRVGSWEDAAWIAERVLTVAELKRALDRLPDHLPLLDEDDPTLDDAYWMSVSEGRWWEREDNAEGRREMEADALRSLRAILARRLARLGRWGEAAPYFPAHLQAPAAAAAAAWDRMEQADRRQDAQARAAAALDFFSAVLPQRFDLLAAETWPDFALAGGGYEIQHRLTQERLASAESSADERARLTAHSAETFPQFRAPPGHPVAAMHAAYTGEDGREIPATPDRRYHFLWHLAELAWVSAEGLPPGDPKLAQLLCRGGRLLRNKLPDQADLFYKRMVWEGRPDPLAQVADGLRWFPPVDDSYTCLALPWPPPDPPPTWAERRRMEWDAMVAAKQAEQAAAEAARAETRARAIRGVSGVLLLGAMVAGGWWWLERQRPG